MIYLNSLCDSTPFWNSSLSWHTDKPSLTLCFLDTALVWPQSTFLWLLLPYVLLANRTLEPKLRSWNVLNICKFSLSALITLLALAEFIYIWIVGSYPRLGVTIFKSHLLATGITCATYGLILVYLFQQQYYGFSNCFPVWIYLLVQIAVSLVSIVMEINQFWLHYFMLVVLILLFLLVSCVNSPPISDIEHPKSRASILSKLTFWWYNSLILLGYRRSLTIEDLYILRPTDCSEYLFKRFNCLWKSEPKEVLGSDSTFSDEKKSTRLSNILLKMFWSYFLFPSAARFVVELLLLANPIMLRYLISFTSNADEPLWHGILYCVGIVLINELVSLVNGYHQNRMAVLGMRVRSCLVGAVYRKSLVLAPHSRQTFTMGEIVNLMAVDSQRFLDMMPTIFYVYTVPVQVALTLGLLWLQLGSPVFGGVVLMIIFIPLNAMVSRRVKKIQTKQMTEKDKRLMVINEMLNGIKVLKLYAWEEAFVKKIEKIRQKELFHIRKSGFIYSIYIILNEGSSYSMACLIFALYIFLDSSHRLTAANAFSSLALFNLLRTPLMMIPNMLASLILAIVSLKRLTRFLNSDEVEKYVKRVDNQTEAITVSRASFSWDGQKPILSDIDLRIGKGSLVAVVGSVGSGKSSLVSALLGDMQRHSGQVSFNSAMRIAYVAQQAWIQNSTLRDNILFGSTLDHSKYLQVIEACALRPDFDMLPGGDFTEIGEKGINLSGGQKQRVSIARACYSQADLYFFDDPLSAVDSHVSKHIYEHVLSSRTGILKSKTRILVTNSLFMLPEVDQIIILNEGTINAIGSYHELMETHLGFTEMMSDYFNEIIDEFDNNSEADLKTLPLNTSIDNDLKPSRSISFKVDGSTKLNSKKEQTEMEPIKQQSHLTDKETVESGQINLKVYLNFIRAVSPFWFTLIIFNYFMMISLSSLSNFWLSAWTDASEQDLNVNQHFYLLIYFIFLLSIMSFAAIGWFCTVHGLLHSSRLLHKQMFGSLIHAPMSFFDTTPVGRMVNRFSRDIDVLDNLQYFVHIFSKVGFRIFGFVATISYETPLFLAFVVPVLICYYVLQRYYVATTRQLKRLESVTRSPILNHFSETILGVSTIKAYGATDRFISEVNRRVDQNQRCYYPSAIASCWISIRLEFLATCLIFLAAFLAIFSKNSLSGSQTGLSLSQALWLPLALNYFVRTASDLENNMVSLERVLEYSRVVPEAKWYTQTDVSLVPYWPKCGAIVFHKYSTSYRPGLDLVLKGVNFAIEQGEKIGIVGRTGAGKSSLTLALFRIIESCEGRISIDGIDISTLGLQKLRSCLTIIPQDPVLFSGTVRFNLDPFDQYSDEQLWHVLKLSHLKGFVDSLELGLSHPIAESGENVSVGQRQLICLARALLRRTPVLVLDEATAAVDHQTDSLIQSTIRSEFAHCTVLTIAHRLHTILDSDRVLVLNAGRIAEFDSPQALLADRHSIFHSLAKDAGIL